MTPLPIHYLSWHYTRALSEGVHIWYTFARYIVRLFGIGLHTRTLISPFHGVRERSPSQGFHPAQAMGAFIVTSLMRIVGAGARSIVVLTGITILILLTCGGIIACVLWLLFPLYIAGGIAGAIVVMVGI